MSRFYASIEGNRGAATRQGTAKSGIEGHIRGWKVGAKIRCFPTEDGKGDIVRVYATHGSTQPSYGSELIAEFTADTFGLCRYCTELKEIGGTPSAESFHCKHGLRPFTCGKYHDCR